MARRVKAHSEKKKKPILLATGASNLKEVIAAGTLNYYETRKVIFDAKAALDSGNADKGILKAVGFELMWLKNKRDFYGSIYKEDESRLVMLESRYKG